MIQLGISGCGHQSDLRGSKTWPLTDKNTHGGFVNQKI
nr:MAG TPA: hypothetical protein [Caudoviricetes sp.]